MKNIKDIIKDHDHENFTEYFSTMIQFVAAPERGAEIYKNEKHITQAPKKKVIRKYRRVYRKVNLEQKKIIKQLEKNTWTANSKNPSKFLGKD